MKKLLTALAVLLSLATMPGHAMAENDTFLHQSAAQGLNRKTSTPQADWFIRKSDTTILHWECLECTPPSRGSNIAQLFELNIPSSQIPKLAGIRDLRWYQINMEADASYQQLTDTINNWVYSYEWTGLELSNFDSYWSEIFTIKLINSRTKKTFKFNCTPYTKGPDKKLMDAFFAEINLARDKKREADLEMAEENKRKQAIAEQEYADLEYRLFGTTRLGNNDWFWVWGPDTVHIFAFTLLKEGTKDTIACEYAMFFDRTRNTTDHRVSVGTSLACSAPLNIPTSIQLIVIDKYKKVYITKQDRINALIAQYKRNRFDTNLSVLMTPTRFTAATITVADIQTLLKQ